MGGERWAVNREEGATLECCLAANIMVLSPDAPQPLEALDPAKTYCIGGVVDRTPKKGITATVARHHTTKCWEKKKLKPPGLDVCRALVLGWPPRLVSQIGHSGCCSERLPSISEWLPIHEHLQQLKPAKRSFKTSATC